MRSAQRLSLTPGEYIDAATLERRRILRELLAELKVARETNAPWYVEALATARAGFGECPCPLPPHLRKRRRRARDPVLTEVEPSLLD